MRPTNSQEDGTATDNSWWLCITCVMAALCVIGILTVRKSVTHGLLPLVSLKQDLRIAIHIMDIHMYADCTKYLAC